MTDLQFVSAAKFNEISAAEEDAETKGRDTGWEKFTIWKRATAQI